MSERPALPVKRAMRFFDPETEPQKFGHRWGKINSYDLPEKLFLAGTQRETYLLPSSSIGGLSFPANCNSALPLDEASRHLRPPRRTPGQPLSLTVTSFSDRKPAHGYHA